MSIQNTIKKYFEFINDEKFDELFRLFCEDADLTCPVGFRAKGIEKIKAFYLMVPSNYPKHLDTPIDTLIQEDRAAVLIQFEGKSASGIPVRFMAIDWFTFENHKIKTLNIFYDSLRLSRLLRKIIGAGDLKP